MLWSTRPANINGGIPNTKANKQEKDETHSAIPSLSSILFDRPFDVHDERRSKLKSKANPEGTSISRSSEPLPALFYTCHLPLRPAGDLAFIRLC